MNNFKYSCFFCKYNTNSSQAWYQHNKGKKHMKNVQIAEQNNNHIVNHKDDVTQCNTKVTPPYVYTKVDTINTESIDSKAIEKKHVCPHCNKIFSTKANMIRHIKNYCKKKKKSEEEEKKKLEEEKKKLEEEEKRKLEEEKNKIELEKQKFMMQFIEKQAEEQRRLMEKTSRREKN